MQWNKRQCKGFKLWNVKQYKEFLITIYGYYKDCVLESRTTQEIYSNSINITKIMYRKVGHIRIL